MSWGIIGLRYILEACKFVIIPYVVFSCILCRINKKEIIRWHKEHISILFSLIYIMTVLLITEVGRIDRYQFDFSAISYQLVLFKDSEYVTMLLNLIMYIPFGILGPITCKKVFLSWKRTAVIGGITSILMETIQTFFLGRLGDINDVVMNTAGCMIGYAAYSCIDFSRFKEMMKKLGPFLLLGICIPINGVCIADMLAWNIGVHPKYIGSIYIKLVVILIVAAMIVLSVAIKARKADSQGRAPVSRKKN